jgi:hypothetical protein
MCLGSAGQDKGSSLFMIYSIGEDPFDNKIKIGFTDREDIAGRLGELQTGNPRKLICRRLIPGTIEEEQKLHQTFAEERLCGEWFTYSERVKIWEETLSKPEILDSPIPSTENSFGNITVNKIDVNTTIPSTEKSFGDISVNKILDTKIVPNRKLDFGKL